MKRQTVLASALFAGALLLFGCSDLFQDRVDMQNSGANGTLSSLLVAKAALEKLPPPKQIFVAAPAKDRIEINWSTVPEATSYRLERAVSMEKDAAGAWIVPPGEDFEVLEHSKSVYSTYFTDLIIDDSTVNPLTQESEAYGCAYFYRVAAENITASITAENGVAVVFCMVALAVTFVPAAGREAMPFPSASTKEM